jgi:hypothetical protein
MYRSFVWTCVSLLTCFTASAYGQKSQRSQERSTRTEPTRVSAPAQQTMTQIAIPARATRVYDLVEQTTSNRLRIGDSTVAGAGVPGSPVYINETNSPALYRPGAGIMIADRLRLIAPSGGNLAHYSILVLGNGASESPTFTVETALWTGDPCVLGSSIIAGTQREFTDVPNDGSLVELNAFFDPTIVIPGTVYLAVTFGPAPAGDDAGWIVAGRPELGFTRNEWSENDPGEGCFQFFFGCGGVYAGFWATVNLDVTTPQLGACCDGVTCTQVLEANCVSGTWQGPYTSCTPNPCVSGACCDGTLLNACTETSAGGCDAGLFHPGVACNTNPCGPLHSDYANTFQVNGFHSTDDPNIKRADDVTRFSMSPCELGGYEILVSGNGAQGPESFDVLLELWTNDTGMDPETGLDDRPSQLIAGSAAQFVNVPADFCPQRLVAGSFAGQGIMLPRKFWVAIRTTSALGGPMLAGPAKLGGSLDAFAEFNTLTPNAWTPGLWFNGFDPTGCPGGPDCNPAGSFRINVWCAGERPTGACCDDRNDICTDGVIKPDCPGRWVEGSTCAEAPFDPPCGNNACCVVNEFNPNQLVCTNTSAENCALLFDPPGAFSPGKFCEEITCPSRTCFDSTGDCFTPRQTTGCEDPFCCEKVCADDDFCCNTRWDETCAQSAETLCRSGANDSHTDPDPFATQGAFAFDNTEATSEGPNHDGCTTLGDLSGINRDLWYCWTAPCTDLVTIETCGRTEVDTKIAVYGGCEGPPADENLIACNDDACAYQSRVNFVTTQGQDYLIRIGSFSAAGNGGDIFPHRPFGPGEFQIECSGLNNPACPGDGACCDPEGNGTPGCDDQLCCNIVCACDSFCCDEEWDLFCATTGFEDSGCGAQVLCGDLCTPSCPIGPITWLDPDSGVVDARLSNHPSTGLPAGIDRVGVQAPSNVDMSCFTLCETAANGTPNEIIAVNESPIGSGVSVYEVLFARPITPFAATTVTYTNDDSIPSTGTYIAHPGNVNADGFANSADLTALVEVLMGINVVTNAPWAEFSADIDHSGLIAPPDVLSLIDGLNGAGGMTPAANTPRPDPTGVCP